MYSTIRLELHPRPQYDHLYRVGVGFKLAIKRLPAWCLDYQATTSLIYCFEGCKPARWMHRIMGAALLGEISATIGVCRNPYSRFCCRWGRRWSLRGGFASTWTRLQLHAFRKGEIIKIFASILQQLYVQKGIETVRISILASLENSLESTGSWLVCDFSHPGPRWCLPLLERRFQPFWQGPLPFEASKYEKLLDTKTLLSKKRTKTIQKSNAPSTARRSFRNYRLIRKILRQLSLHKTARI